MDYIGHICPVCNKRFHADDDVVVCPECGTPHHRDCYEQLGHCANVERHAQGYDYMEEEHELPKAKQCPSCGKENDENSFFCKYCGSPLTGNQPRQNTADTQPQFKNNIPFGMGSIHLSEDDQDENGQPVPFLDPLAGVPNDQDFGDGVTAGEAAKYVKQNTPYFMHVFSNISATNRSRFNFSAALLTSGYLLYRKMYRIGAALFALQVALFSVILYFMIVYRSVYENFYNSVTGNSQDYMSMADNYSKYLLQQSSTDLMILYLPIFILMVFFVIKIVVGACFNRLYFKHCKQQITQIKRQADGADNPDTLLQTKGGVNAALGASIITTAMIIYFFTRILII